MPDGISGVIAFGSPITTPGSSGMPGTTQADENAARRPLDLARRSSDTGR